MALSELKLILSDWDNMHKDFLINCYSENKLNPQFIVELIQLLPDEKLQKASSWLLKHHIEKSNFTPQQKTAIITSVFQLKYWESQLHILQMLPKLHINKRQAGQLEPFVNLMLKSDNKFVKAAAFEAYYEIVKHYPALKNEFKQLCELALERESASVKVKIKRILAQV